MSNSAGFELRNPPADVNSQAVGEQRQPSPFCSRRYSRPTGRHPARRHCVVESITRPFLFVIFCLRYTKSTLLWWQQPRVRPGTVCARVNMTRAAPNANVLSKRSNRQLFSSTFMIVIRTRHYCGGIRRAPGAVRKAPFAWKSLGLRSCQNCQ